MLNRVFMKGFLGLSITFTSLMTYAASMEGYWKSIDDRTGEQLSIVEIRKGADGVTTVKLLIVILFLVELR